MATAWGEEAHVQDQTYPLEAEHSGLEHKEDERAEQEFFTGPDRGSDERKRKRSSSWSRRDGRTHVISGPDHQIRRFKQVGRTTKNSRLLFTTCLIQMVLGSRGQPREFIKETYVYVEAASLWTYVLTLLVSWS